MSAPQIPLRFPLPPMGEQPQTYADLIQKINCICAAGATIQAASLPSATINMGDIIADATRVLSAFTSVYSVIAVVMRMISCIIDVLCALMNPFSLIFAMIRLFGTCLPDFLLIFPQFAIPAKILCIIKIILAVVNYVLNVLIPIIEEIIANIESLYAAFRESNNDGIAAIVFKLANLFKEIMSVLGILAALMPLYLMIKALMNMGISIPCGGDGGSCVGCGDDLCPKILQQSSLDGTDGRLTVIFTGIYPYEFRLVFSSVIHRNDFLSIKDFFPHGLDYEGFDVSDLPYVLEYNGVDYIVTSVDDNGYLNIQQLQTEKKFDGYLSSVYDGGLPMPDVLHDVRFGTHTQSFSSASLGTYITIEDVDSGTQNSGTWYVAQVFDAYNVVLRRSEENAWTASNVNNPSVHLYWRKAPSVPSSSGTYPFSLKFNHAELIRYELINLGCHPAIKASKDATSRRYSAIAQYSGPNLGLPDLPDLEGLILNLNTCITNIVPADVTPQYILDNYGSITPMKVAEMGSCIESLLNQFKDESLAYAKNIFPRMFDPESSQFSATPLIQIVGKPINIDLIVLDRYGERLAKGFPPNTIAVEILSTNGILSSVSEVLDDNGMPIGSYIATLNSHHPTTATLTAKVEGIFVGDFDGYSIVNREINVEFISSSDMQQVANIKGVFGEVSTEPLGKVHAR